MACTSPLGHLFGTVFEGILWGLYFVLFLVALFLFRRRRGKQTGSFQIISAAMLWMFCSATAHFAVDVRSLQQGLVQNATVSSTNSSVLTYFNGSYFGDTSTLPANSSIITYLNGTYFNDTSRPLYVVDKSLDGLSMLIGNGLLIYRVYDMMPHVRWIVVFLVTLLLGAGVVEFYITDQFSQLQQNDPSLFAHQITQLSPAVFTLPLVLGFFITFFILLRIHHAEGLACTRDGMLRLTRTRRMIITAFESAILLPCYFLVLLILYYTRSGMVEVVLMPISQVTGIVPTIIWIQARLGLTRYDAAIEHYAFTVSRDMQFAAPERFPTRPSHRPLECLFKPETDVESNRTKEPSSPVGSLETLSTGTPKPPQCIPRGQPWHSPSIELMQGPERREHQSSYR